MPSPRHRHARRVLALVVACGVSTSAGGVVTVVPAFAAPAADALVEPAAAAAAAPAPEDVVQACGSCGPPLGPVDLVAPPDPVTAGELLAVSFVCVGTADATAAELTDASGAENAPMAVEESDDAFAAQVTVPAEWEDGTGSVSASCAYGTDVVTGGLHVAITAAPPITTTTVPTTTTTTVPTSTTTSTSTAPTFTQPQPLAASLPAMLPAPDGVLEVSVVALVPQGTTMLLGRGYHPGTEVRFAVYSEPVLLGTATVDGRGVAELVATLPAGLAFGEHTVVSFGVDATGHERVLSRTITVTSAAPAVLPRTGSASGLLTVVGTLLVTVGGLVLAVRHRRLVPAAG